MNFPKDKPYGIKYDFYLEDAVGSVENTDDNDEKITYFPEYMIYLDRFIEKMNDAGLDVEENMNFMEFYL